jgi:hypothetical protein
MGLITDYIASCNSTFDTVNADWLKLAQSGLDKSQSAPVVDLSYMSAVSRLKSLTEVPRVFPEEPKLDHYMKILLPSEFEGWKVSCQERGEFVLYSILLDIAAYNSRPFTPLKGSGGGPQLYVCCVQIEVVDGGSESLPGGTKAGSLCETVVYLANFNFNSAVGNTDIGPAIFESRQRW